MSLAVPFLCAAGRAYVRHLDDDGVTSGISGPFDTAPQLERFLGAYFRHAHEVRTTPDLVDHETGAVQLLAYEDLVAPVVAAEPAPPVRAQPDPAVGQFGFTGSLCSACGSASMVRAGTCELCQSCGTTTGCS